MCDGHRKEAEKVDIEEKYASLQEEAAAKTARLKDVWKQFQKAKKEVCTCTFSYVLCKYFCSLNLVLHR